MNQEHYEILMRGVAEWNKWRKKHLDIRPDLSGADLTREDLAGADLHGADLTGANIFMGDLTNADLRGANLAKADLSGANLSDANLYEAKLSGITWCSAIIDGARVNPKDIDGPGHILCALTDEEWAAVKAMRRQG